VTEIPKNSGSGKDAQAAAGAAAGQTDAAAAAVPPAPAKKPVARKTPTKGTAAPKPAAPKPTAAAKPAPKPAAPKPPAKGTAAPMPAAPKPPAAAKPAPKPAGPAAAGAGTTAATRPVAKTAAAPRPAARRPVRRTRTRVTPPPVRIGIISDTHGKLYKSVPRLFEGVVHIIHAGDVGKRSVLRRLEAVAPVTAVSGNVDRGKLLAELPTVTSGEAGGVKYLVIHKPKHLKRQIHRAKDEGVRLIVVGHLHEPSVAWEDGILLVNPGTASSLEEGDPAPTVALVSIMGESLAVTFLPVEVAAKPA
jgi:uncharacterized protein